MVKQTRARAKANGLKIRGWRVFAFYDVLLIEHDDGWRFVSQMQSEWLH